MRTSFLIVLGCILVSFGVMMIWWNSQDLEWIPSCTTSGGGHWGPKQYYDGSAPDGWYNVWCTEDSENGTVFFPLCPNSGSRLHGTWKTAVFIEQYFDSDVRLQNNVIVEKR